MVRSLMRKCLLFVLVNLFFCSFLCNGDFSSTAGFPTNFNQLNITSNSSCLRVSGQLIISSEDGNEMILSSKANEGYDASFIDTSSGTVLGFSYENWNQSGYEYDFKITKAGIERPAAMEIKLQSLLSAFGGISQFDDNGGDISSGLEGFLDSSSSFTFMIARAGTRVGITTGICSVSS